MNFAGETSDPDCFCKSQPALFLQAVDMEKKRKAEDISGNILGFYKQMKLQEVIQNTPYLDKNVKENLLYTNATLLNSIARTIDETSIDFPKTFANLTNDQNTNTILDAMQNRSKHLQLSSNNGR